MKYSHNGTVGGGLLLSVETDLPTEGSLEALHEDVHLAEEVAQLALHSLPLEQERPDGQQLVVAAHALVVPFFPGDVHADAGRCSDVRLDDGGEVLEQNAQTGTTG